MIIKDVILKEIKGIWGSEPIDEDSTTPVIKTNNMSYEGYINYDNITYRVIPTHKLSDSYLLTGDLLVEKSGGTKTHTVGYVNIFENNSNQYVCNNFILGLRPNQEIVLSKYLFFQLKYLYEIGAFSDCYNKTTGIQNLKVDSYLSKQIICPSKDKQYDIVKHLESIVLLIDNKRQQLAKLDELVNSKFYEMLECKNYPISTIGECCTLKSGTTFKKELELESGDYMYIKVSDMNLPGNEKYIRTSKTYVSSSSIKNFAIPGNSIIFPKRGGAIATNKKRITQNTICVDLNTMAVTPNSTLNLDYLYQFFVNIDMGKLYNGAAVPQINNKDIAPLKISIPPLELQEQFANFAQKIERAKDVVSKQIDNLQELLDSRMDFYFRQ